MCSNSAGECKMNRKESKNRTQFLYMFAQNQLPLSLTGPCWSNFVHCKDSCEVVHCLIRVPNSFNIQPCQRACASSCSGGGVTEITSR